MNPKLQLSASLELFQKLHRRIPEKCQKRIYALNTTTYVNTNANVHNLSQLK